MKTQSIDTSIEAESILISLLRKKTPEEKFSHILSLSESMIQLSKRAIRRANKGISDDEVNRIFVELHYGKDLADKFQKQLKCKRDNT